MQNKVLFLEHNVDGTVGGSQICLLGICKHLDRNRWIPVVCFYQGNPLVTTFLDSGVEVLILEPFKPWIFDRAGFRGHLPGIGFVQSIVNFLRMLLVRPWKWIVLLRKMGIELVHLNNSCSGDVDLVLAAKLLRIKVLAHQRGFPPEFGRFQRAVARRLDKIIAVSDVIKEYLVACGIPETKVVRIHDGIELDRLRQRRPVDELLQQFGLEPDQPVIGMLGNIKRWKGQEVVVDALVFICRRFPDTHLLFVGQVADDSYKQVLDDKISAHRLGNRVIFTGYRSDATDLIAIMDVVIHASIEAEPFGLVVLEAMGKGKPIVAADLGGPKETVVDGATGLLFESGNPQSLATAVCQYLADSSMRLLTGAAGARHVASLFSAQRNAQDIERVYGQVLHNRS